MEKGLFITFEGIDGCGKTTQAERFASRLFEKSKYNHVLLTREPYNSEEIRARLRDEKNAYDNPKKLADLYIENRRLHIRSLIKPNLESGVHVVCDRYDLSTIAYQSAQGLDMDNLIRKHKRLPVPYLTVVINVSVKTAMQRSPRTEKKFETPKFQKIVKAKYQEAIEKLKNKRRIIVIHGEDLIDKVEEDVWRSAIGYLPLY